MVKVDFAFSEPSGEALLAQGGPITVPDAHLLFTADFSRSGHDLMLTGEDGNTLLIADYFGPHGPVDLVSPEGAILTSSVVKSLAGPLAPGQYAQAGEQQPAEAIGKVVTLEGSATAQRTDGTVVELSIGDSVALGDVLQTASGANVGISFVDGSVFHLSSGSRMVLDNLIYQAGGSDNSMTFNLVQGTFSFVAGQIAPTGEMRIETPVATMGIRGTSGIVKVASIDGASIYRVIPDPGTGHVGAYVLYSKIDGTILATVNAADLQWLLTSPTGTPTSEPADPNDQQIIDDLIEAFERRNAGLDDGGSDGQDGGTRVVTIGSGIDTGINPLDPRSVEAQLVDLFAGLSEDDTEEPQTPGLETTDTTTVIDTGGNTPVIGNQPASFGGDTSGDAVEDVGTATGGQVVVNDPDGGSQSGVQPLSNVQGQFGAFTIDAAGNWTYVLNNADPDVQALPQGVTATDSFVVTSADGSATITIVITITGTNDVPVITGSTIGGVGEDAIASASGVITVNDPDTGESSVAPQANVAGSYGSFAITAAGVWTYNLNNANAAVQALPAGATLTESFTVFSADGTASETIVITITGTNDVAVVGGTAVGAVAENSETTTATGSLTVSDIDTGEAVFQTQSGTAGAYGSFSIDANGNWTYTLNNANAAVDALNVGDTLQDSFTVLTADGTPQVVTVTITGSNDAAIITGTDEGAVTEEPIGEGGGSGTATGDLNASDVDSPETFQAQTDAPGTYGAFSIDANGQWSYVLNNELPATQALADGQVETETFTVYSADGTAHEVTITITGSNDAAIIGGVTSGEVTEDAYEGEAQTISTWGTLTVSDVDNNPASFAAATGETAHGTFEVDSQGNWVYTLNNEDEAVDSLNVGDTLQDSFTVMSNDGTEQVVSITINGSNDAPVGQADGLTTSEDTSLYIDPADLLANDGDVDNAHGDLFIDSVESGVEGTAYITEGGFIAFHPDENFSGEASFSYVVSDGAGGYSDPVFVTVNVEAVADAPYLTASTVSAGFETGDFTGWQTLGNTVVSTEFTGFEGYPLDSPILPYDYSSYMAVLGTDGASEADIEAFLGLAPGTLDNQGNGDATVGSTMVFELQVSAGDVVTFDWNFITNDYLPYNDYAVLTINGQFIELADVASLGNTAGNVSETGWTTYTYNVTQTGTLTIGFAIVDVGDAIVDSALLVDNIQVNYGSSIPLDINAGLTDTDGSETLAITIAGVPQDATLSAGTDLGDGVWSLTPEQLIGLSINPPLYFYEPINLQITATATETSNGDQESTTTTLTIEPPYYENYFASQSFSSDMSLMMVDTAEAPEQMMFAASSEPVTIWTGPGLARRDGDGRGHGEAATMHAIAAAAGLTVFGPHWAQAAEMQHQANDSTPAHDGDGRGWHGPSIADLAGLKGGADGQPDFHRPIAHGEPGPAGGGDRHFTNLSDLVGQHFEGLSAARDTAEGENGLPSRGQAERHENADARIQHGPDTSHPVPQARAVSEQGKDADTHGRPGTDGAADPEASGQNHLDGIVDFSNLPAFFSGQAFDAGAKALSSLAELKHADFAGLVDFSRDLLPEPQAAAIADRIAQVETGGMHAAIHEIVHVAINDVIQNMAHDAEAASQHHPN